MQSDILSYGPSYNYKPTITVKSIFTDNNNWDAFQLSEKDNLRDVEIKEVTKMMTCNSTLESQKIAATIRLAPQS